jgi:hypothetical protein
MTSHGELETCHLVLYLLDNPPNQFQRSDC